MWCSMTGNGVGWARKYNFKNLCTSHFLKLSTGLDWSAHQADSASGLYV